MESNQKPGVGTAHVAQENRRPPELERLNALIGRWINEGQTVSDGNVPAVPIVASDVYQWVAGGHFVMHPAYGRIGEVGVGGLEVIGFDPETRQYKCDFYDSFGNVTSQTLSYRDGKWIWQGKDARCTGTFSDDGKTLIARHERSEDGTRWVPSMNVTLRRVD